MTKSNLSGHWFKCHSNPSVEAYQNCHKKEKWKKTNVMQTEKRTKKDQTDQTEYTYYPNIGRTYKFL